MSTPRAESSRTRRPGPVLFVSLGLTLAIVAWGAAAGESLSRAGSAALDGITRGFGWAYLLVSLGFLVFLLFLACSRFGRLRLGRDDERPAFRRLTWYAMILSAVMGIGLISYGVAEPIAHLAAPPHGLAAPMTTDAAVTAMQFSFFDWGLHAWGIFAVVGLAMAWSMFRRGRTGLVSALFRPLLGRRADGPVGGAIDVFAVVATLFGTTTSLGLGAMQINGGFTALFGIPNSTGVQFVIIGVITLLFTASALTGVARGIRYLSEASMGLGAVLFVFVLIAGPTVYLLDLYVQSVGRYLSELVATSLITPANGDIDFMQSWTYFMLAWWLSWAAFVGVFLARISRGRTVREFVVGVLLVPSLVFSIWFTAFGGTAIHTDLAGTTRVAAAAAADANSAFFTMLQSLPLPSVTSVVTIVLVVLFFVSGADANTYVLGMLTSRGTEHPPAWILALWGLVTGAAAMALLVAGGLESLQQMVIVSSAPFLVVVVGVAVAFWRDLSTDPVLPPAGPGPAPGDRETTGGEDAAVRQVPDEATTAVR
ncbi:glycine/betaine ABC transporter permease [Pseudonocardia sp. EC080610-09]|uniref:BCCT family transporter n=1 Tax=unclassified Pseudonocardia TaxID=2619320 RepID=UPI0006CB7138|nr:MULTISPECIES: BCCT family transporter [unclassified Pseudonocardia]ALE73346.1 glycine/betaine ABC transporter permease [Pseudonocardia sp. EC080625-04]ALL76682.1 glycine/betaine ABC transporter permease [Pseudonocardia sp. EC080610-09]ALL83710.1 glycine/betaine ABC transporter permease [Pseudonocardia sp. EC080619-01]